MRLHRRIIIRSATAAFLALGLLAAPVRAEEPAERPFEEPGLSYAKRSAPYIQWATGALFVAACVAAAFKNPHRSHLD
jgi:hypothetical protein